MSTMAASAPLEPDPRVEDYLDDKLQDTTDLEKVDELLASVELQRSQLQSQLDRAAEELHHARQSAEERRAEVAARLDDFARLQQSIDVRLRIVAESDAPDEAMRRLERPMKQLRAVDLARRYLVLLRDVDDLRAAARSHLPRDPKAALEPYSRLRRLATRLRELQGPADGAAVHLTTHVATAADALWDEMRATMRQEMDAVLKQRGWPRVDPGTVVDDEWRQCFEKLVDLQVPEVLYSPAGAPPVSLLPVDAMAHIFAKEFRFHFLSERPTSSAQAIDTHCFPWFLSLVERWEDFFTDNFGLILAAKFRDTPAATRLVYVDPVCAFITSMLPVMREKLERVVAEALRDPAFLSRLMAQLMTFDETLRSRFGYDGGDDERGWGGLTAEVLDKHFDAWLRAEKDFALERFRTIMATPDARSIDYDFAGPGKTKPTHGAVRVTDLLRSVTAQYERVRRFSHQLRFLVDIQLDILDEYHDRLRGSLELYQSLTTAVGRTLHGVTKEQLAALEGTGALETLCKVYGSADYVVNTLREWSDEEFFVTLWERLQARAKVSTDQTQATRKDLAGGMSYDQVRDRTSVASMGTDDDGGALFDETVAAYALRRRRAEEFLVEALADSHYKAFRPYLQLAQWTTISDDSSSDPYQFSITAELDKPLSILRRNLDFLSRALGSAPFRRVWREALSRLNATLWSELVMAQKFTALGAAQLARDLAAVAALVDRYLPHGSGVLESVVDAARLLNLPVEVGDGDADADADAEWGGEGRTAEEGGDGNGGGGGEGRRAVVSLKRAYDMVLTDNAEATKLLDMLGIDSLTPANARQILRRRVENSD